MPASHRHRYLVALGSNVQHARYGRPAKVVAAALAHLNDAGVTLEITSPIMTSPPLGPSRRQYANAVAIMSTELSPTRLLAALKRMEARFGRRLGGMRWRARVLDLDVILWDGGRYAGPGLIIPHREFRKRTFVLQPALRIARAWRDPVTGLTVAHLTARLTRPRPALRAQPSRNRRRLGGP